MGTTVERDLKTLRTSKLMNISEFKTMMVFLEKYHKEQARDKRKDDRELDLRPYLYDDGDTYEKPFYNILLKMLYEVASFKSHDKQHQDLLKVYDWFRSNQKLVAKDSEDGVNVCDPPKLYLRPRTADNCCRENAKEDSNMKEARSRSVLSYDEHQRRSQNKSYNPLDRISVSLKVRPINVDSVRAKTVETEVHGKRTRRHFPSSVPVYNTRTNRATSLPSSFVLKPAKPTTPPLSTPVSSPSVSVVTSPRFRSPSLCPRLSPVHRAQSPPQLSLSGHSAIDKRQLVERHYDDYLTADDYGLNSYYEQPPSLRNQRGRVVFDDNEMNNNHLVATDEEGDMFHHQLRQRLEHESFSKTAEIVDNFKKDVSLLKEERENLESHLVREHLQYMKDRFGNGGNGGQPTKTREEDEISEQTLLGDEDQVKISVPQVKVYDFSEHRPVSAVTFRERGVRVQSVTDMVQPVGHQMEYERNVRNQQNGGTIWDSEYDGNAFNHRRTQSAPSSDIKFIYGQHQNRSPNNIARLNQTEPIFTPERKPGDYTVHFPHQCERDPPVKEYKTSGLVAPDTIRYQWTDDGFGNRTYIRRRTPKETQGTKSSRKVSPSTINSDVTMTTGTRGLDKKTLASLIVIKHLGTTNRRERAYPSSDFDWKEYSSVTSDDNPDDSYTSKQNVEYLPFWKQVPPKKELTVLNFPELAGPPEIYCDDKSKDSDLTRSNASDMTSSENTSPQQIMGEMFANLSPARRSSGRQMDCATLSINARSISPTRKPVQVNRRLVVSPAPSRPSSARRTPSPSPSNKDQDVNFSAKDFSHFCLHDDHELLDDYAKQREIWAAVNIQRIFRGHVARQYTQSLRQAEKERERKAAIAVQSSFRGYLARKKLIEKNITHYKPNVRDLQWAKDYKEKLKEKENLRNKRNQGVLKKQNRQFEKQQEQMQGVTASGRIHEIFNRPKPSKSEMKAAAITIQRFFRGWFVRKSLKTTKEKVLKRTFSFNKFIKSYQDLVSRIQSRYNIENPQTALQFHELKEYVERLVQYEIAFGKIAENGTLNYEDIMKYFAECGHHPSEKEIDDAITLVTKDIARGRNLKKAEAVEVVFQIYIPKGTGLSLGDVRKSTWANPLVDGQDVRKGLSKKELKRTNLDKCFSLVADAQGERNEIKELLRSPEPRMAAVVDRTSDKYAGKPRSRPSTPKMAGGGKLILPRAQYHPPVKPSDNKQRRPASGNARK